jgi:E3 ubiquitin-protein ligase UBR1
MASNGLEQCMDFTKKYALAFLRKVTMLLHVRYGVAFHHHLSTSSDADELDRLTEALHLPSFQEILDLSSNPTLAALVQGWIGHTNQQSKISLSLSHPTIFELVGLPKNYDTLM